MIDLRSPRRRHAGANGAARGLWNASARQVQSRTPTATPVGAVARGLVAGAVGTAAMDTFLFARYRRNGGNSSAEAVGVLGGGDQLGAGPRAGARW